MDYTDVHIPTDVKVVKMSVWTQAFMDSLPDSSFALISDGGKKDGSGKTVPRSLRHFPFRDAAGKADAPHVRNALARIPQSSVSQAEKDAATAKVRAAAKGLGIGLSEDAFRLSEEETQSVMMFPIGNYMTAKYPKLNLSRDMAEKIVDNYNNKTLGATEPVISSGSHEDESPASGWIKGVGIKPWKKGEALYADVAWTSEGNRQLKEKLFRYVSPLIAAHTVPETGEEVSPVLKSATLTNKPVLRMMGPIMASDAEDMEIACSEMVQVEEIADEVEPQAVTEGEPVAEGEPVVEGEPATEDVTVNVIDQFETAANALTALLKGKRGTPALRETMKEVTKKARAGQPVAATDLLNNDTLREEMNMNKVFEYLKLAEASSEEDVVAAIEAKLTEAATSLVEAEGQVTKLTEERDAVKAQLAEVQKESHDAAVEVKLSEALSLGEIDAAEKEALAAKDDASRDAFLDARKGMKRVDLTERGTGTDIKEKEKSDKRADVLLREATEAIMASEKLTYLKAQNKALANDPQLKEKYLKLREEITVGL